MANASGFYKGTAKQDFNCKNMFLNAAIYNYCGKRGALDNESAPVHPNLL